MAVIGIDLGTTHSLVAVWKSGQCELIPNALGSRLTPSAVSVDSSGDIIVGQAAKDRLITHPGDSVARFKRLMGTSTVTRLGSTSFTPEELSSLVLRQLKEDAESYLGEEVTEAVISVPAYYNDNQRKATYTAARLAGLKVERLINEPTAAAIAYGVHEGKPESTFIVIDLGGGTLDVSILEKFDTMMEVHASAGDSFLGGEDFTQALVEWFCKENALDLERLSPNDKSRLYRSCDLVKIQLGKQSEAEINIEIEGTGYTGALNQDLFIDVCKPLLDRLRSPIERAVKDGEIPVNQFDDVILVGGASRMPLIRRYIARLFGRLPSSNINPDEVVVMGAAVQAALKSRDEAIGETVLTDVCPFSLGVDVSKEINGSGYRNGFFSVIIERNTVIPASREQSYITLMDGQTKINMDVFQGEHRLVKNNIKLGTFEIAVPSNQAGRESVDVRFTYDNNGILEVIATVTSTGKSERLVIQNRENRLSDQEIEKILKKLSRLKLHPRDQAENKALLAEGERLYEESLGPVREHIQHDLMIFESLLEGQNTREIDRVRARLKAKFKKLQGDWLPS